MRFTSKLLIGFLLFFSAQIAFAQSNPTDPDDESSRQIVLDRFNKARPLAEAAKGGMDTGASVKPPVYRRTGSTRINRRGARPPSG